jgi:hypothetical protein
VFHRRNTEDDPRVWFGSPKPNPRIDLGIPPVKHPDGFPSVNYSPIDLGVMVPWWFKIPDRPKEPGGFGVAGSPRLRHFR